jgi:hypothetical protein
MVPDMLDVLEYVKIGTSFVLNSKSWLLLCWEEHQHSMNWKTSFCEGLKDEVMSKSPYFGLTYSIMLTPALK